MIRKVAASLALLAAATPAWARDEPAAAIESADDQAEARRRDGTEVVVTGQRTIPGGQVAKDSRLGILGDSDVYAAPFSVKAYTAELIRDQGARSINDIVAYDPSIRVSLSSTFVLDQSSIRGFLVVSSSYLFDNLPGMTPSYGTVPIAHFDRVDIFKGPASALTAAVGTVGGTINLAPKRAIDVPVNSVTVSAQNDVLLGGHADFGRRFGPGGAFGVRVNVSAEKGTLFDGGRREQWTPTIALDYRGGPFRATIDAGYIEYKSEGPGVNYSLRPGATLPRAPDPTINITPRWSFTDNESWYAIGGAELDLAEGVTAYARYGENRQYVQRVNLSISALDSAGAFNVTGYSYGPWRNAKKTGEIGVRARAVTGPLTHNLVVSALQLKGGLSEFGGASTALTGQPAGSIYRPYPLADPYAAGLPADNIVGAVQPNLQSVAVADDIGAFDDRLRVILSARRQRLRQAPYDQTRTTPTVAALFKVTPTLSLYANYAEALTPGAVAPSDGTVDNPGEQLPPYVSRQHELGAKWNAGRFGVTLAWFDIRQDFAVIADRRFVIGGEQRNRGVELETFGEPVKGVRVLGGAAWIDAIQSRTATGATTGRKAMGVPEWTVNLGVEHDLAALPGFTVTARYIHTGKSFVDLVNTQVVPAWDRFDATARYRVQVQDTLLTVRAGVTNVFDDRYWTAGGRNIISVAAPRTWFTSLSADF